MPCLKEKYIDSDMTRALYGPKVDFMESIKLLAKISLVFIGFPEALPADPFLAGTGDLRIVWRP